MNEAPTKDARYWATYPLGVMARGHVLNDEEVRLMCAALDRMELENARLRKCGNWLAYCAMTVTEEDAELKASIDACTAATEGRADDQ
ncbi:MAG: hypothetical protein CML55_01325 [Rhodobacteraceae bacterium]|nr:hypothetical protein [Paracoccaceae bacterium]MBO28561.1 hypothetical protein [Paracoccaceae bacterium]|tara:strand:+ start:8 stop:271 length:264 start_codon:yes stop_codon:yes gene_type:complete